MIGYYTITINGGGHNEPKTNESVDVVHYVEQYVENM